MQQNPPIRVLIVEDESIIAMDMQRKIGQMGYEVVGRVGSGEKAIERAQTLKPDLVLMDIKLRGALDGIATARAIKQQSDIPVIFVSAYTSQESVIREGGPLSVAMIQKPFEVYELKAVMGKVFPREES
jgi:CheY-like chemotaxis protein